MKGYGKELILDLHNCDPTTFNRVTIAGFFDDLCKAIDMERHDLYFWDDYGVPENEKQTDPKTKGTTAVQFIMTSNVTIHALDLLGKVFLNVFSCKDFDSDIVADMAENYFCGSVAFRHEVDRICILTKQ